MKDPYEILEITKNASIAEIKSAYRGLVLKYHPDRNGGKEHADELFREVTSAYKLLTDPDKKRRYDLWGQVDEDYYVFKSSISKKFSNLNMEAEEEPIESEEEELERQKFSNYYDMVKDSIKKKTTDNIVECRVCKGIGRTRIEKGFFTVTEKCKDCNGNGYIYVRDFTAENKNKNNDNGQKLKNLFGYGA